MRWQDEERCADERRARFKEALDAVCERHCELFRQLALSELEDDRERLIDDWRD